MTPKEKGRRHSTPHQSTPRHSTTPEHNPIIRARRKPNSLREAINAMCASCMGCTEQMIEPGFRNEIRDCSASHCPLWGQRPYQSKCGGQDGHRSDPETMFAPGVVSTGTMS